MDYNERETIEVTPLAGVWIEIVSQDGRYRKTKIVTPLAGVWIEIAPKAEGGRRKMSLPSRECGLKLEYKPDPLNSYTVTPLAGVWIEIIAAFAFSSSAIKSLPSRECGLKFRLFYQDRYCHAVTPLAGVWIEISSVHAMPDISGCHSPRGSVD